MNKRSAIATAGGLAASFMAAAAAVAFNWGIGASTPTSVSAAASPSPKGVKPRVRHRTIVVHKKSPGSRRASGTTFVVPGPTRTPSAAIATTAGSHAGGSEHDDSDSQEHDD